MKKQAGSAAAAVLILVLAVAVGAASALMFVQFTQGAITSEAISAAVASCGSCVGVHAGAPILVGIVAAVAVSLKQSSVAKEADGNAPAARPAAKAAAAPAKQPSSADAALRLLALFQQEGRLVDFLLEEISGYDDAQIGAAVRAIHAGCRSVLRERLQLERILEGDDGDVVEVPSGFDAAAIRVTGNVAGVPPFKGTLQHSGWRVTRVTLPESSADARIVAPAEVEVA
jgi:hypothetical protein